jgi:hypothetical protein
MVHGIVLDWLGKLKLGEPHAGCTSEGRPGAAQSPRMVREGEMPSRGAKAVRWTAGGF